MYISGYLKQVEVKSYLTLNLLSCWEDIFVFWTLFLQLDESVGKTHLEIEKTVLLKQWKALWLDLSPLKGQDFQKSQISQTQNITRLKATWYSYQGTDFQMAVRCNPSFWLIGHLIEDIPGNRLSSKGQVFIYFVNAIPLHKLQSEAVINI